MTDTEYSDFVRKHVYLNEDTLEKLKKGEITVPTLRPFLGASLDYSVPEDSVVDFNSPFGKVKIKMKYNLLTEAYIRTEKTKCFEYLKAIQLYFLGKKSEKDFKNYCNNHDLGLEIVAGENLLGGYFSTNSARIIIQMTNDIKVEIMTSSEQNLKLISDVFWVNFTHEDTHKQQFNKSKLSFKNYKPSTIQYWDEDFDKSFDYFNQKVEADAYGREIGARLSELYKLNKKSGSAEKIFRDIIANNIDDLYSRKIINAYKDPRIDKDTMKSFYRALYDFLEENEKTE